MESKIISIVGGNEQTAELPPMRRFLTIDGLTEKTGWKKSYIYKLTHAKILPHYKISGLLMFADDEIDDFIISHRVKPVDYSAINP
jgi:predicted DNA-binding transcriptional regulator AlpA